MHHLKWNDEEVTNLESLVRVYFMKLDGRHTRISVLHKAVGQHLKHSLTSQWVSKDVDFAELTIGSYVVHAANMVIVGMGYQDAVDAAEGLWHNLLAEVGTAVDKQTCRITFHECRTT